MEKSTKMQVEWILTDRKRPFLVTIMLRKGISFILETQFRKWSLGRKPRGHNFPIPYSRVIKSRMIILEDKYQIILKTWKKTKMEIRNQGKASHFSQVSMQNGSGPGGHIRQREIQILYFASQFVQISYTFPVSYLAKVLIKLSMFLNCVKKK